jgi:hypothetical protein
MLNHSCQPNASWSFKGLEFQLIAERDIFADDEILIYYRGKEPEYCLRRELQEGDPFWKPCNLCVKGHQGPEGSFRDELMSVIDSWPRPSPEEIIKSIETAIEEMIKAGFGYGDFPMRELHFEAFRAYKKTERFTDALKYALRLYFEVDLLCVPAPFAQQRYASAVALTSALNNSAQVPDDIKVFLPRIRYYLRKNLVLAAKKWCGEDSIISKYEREI